MKYTIHYEYYSEDEARAWAVFGLMCLLSRLQLGVADANISQSHAGDITLTVEKIIRRPSAQPE